MGQVTYNSNPKYPTKNNISQNLKEFDAPKITSFKGETEAYSFAGYTKLATVNIQGVDKVPAGFFQNCPVIKTLNISNVGEIGDYAFANTAENPNKVLQNVQPMRKSLVQTLSSRHSQALLSKQEQQIHISLASLTRHLSAQRLLC